MSSRCSRWRRELGEFLTLSDKYFWGSHNTFSDWISRQTVIRLASFLEYKYIPDVNDPPSWALVSLGVVIVYLAWANLQAELSTTLCSAQRMYSHKSTKKVFLNSTFLAIYHPVYLFSSAAKELSFLSELLPLLSFSLEHSLVWLSSSPLHWNCSYGDPCWPPHCQIQLSILSFI